MIATLIIICIAFYWMLRETDYMRVRLPMGKSIPRNQLKMTIAQWDQHDKDHAKELEQSRKEYAKQQAEIKARTCPICRIKFEDPIIKTEAIIIGNSTSRVTGCPDCIAKYRDMIDKSQFEKPRKVSFKACQLPMDAFIKTTRTGSHRDWIETDDKGHGYHNFVNEFKTVYHDCLPGKDWLEAHYKDEYPEQIIELSIGDKALSLNGNYKHGMIKEFIKANK